MTSINTKVKLIVTTLVCACIVQLFPGCSNIQEREVTSNDWPQFKKDNFRSANSGTSLDLSTLGEDWRYESSQWPSPAWYGPAKEDAYSYDRPLPSMRDYDLAYYPVIVGNSLFYGSSSDDAVHCINTKSGKEEWIYTTNGPIRNAPAYYKGRIYIGSDDGFVYCLNATNGELIWKFSPVPDQERLLLNNGRLISFYPIRTGVTVEDDIVYFGASLLPWKKSYLCAIDAISGKVNKPGTYVREFEGKTFEGTMASTGERLIQPQGRIAPSFFNKFTGEDEGQLPGTGGCFVLVTPEKHVVHPFESDKRSVVEYAGKKKPEFMTFMGGKELLVSGDTSYILFDDAISAYNRAERKTIWLKKGYNAHRIILSGNVLYAGATDTVYAVSTNNGLPLWKGNVEGTVYALAVGDSALFASTDQGNIYCFRSEKSENKIYARNLNMPATIEERGKKIEEEELSESLELSKGPFVNIVDKKNVELKFYTKEVTVCSLNWINGDVTKSFTNDKAATSHVFSVPVRKDFLYHYQIIAEGKVSQLFEYDNFFNYSIDELKAESFPHKDESVRELADNFLAGENFGRGLCVIAGVENGQLPVEIAKSSKMDVIVFDDSEEEVNTLRQLLQDEGIYGRRLSVHKVDNLSNLPITSDVADLVICLSGKVPADDIIRITAPKGVAYYLQGETEDGVAEKYKESAGNSNSDWQVTVENRQFDNNWYTALRKKEFETAGVWSHQYGNPDNSAFSGESFWGSTSNKDFEVQWMGRPGPRYQTDRTGRKPAPLAVNGKMFLQGKERIVAVNAYNGSILWSKDVVGMMRMNIHRDCSNWAAGGNDIFISTNSEQILRLDQESGKSKSVLVVEESVREDNPAWGYIACKDGLILGTATRKGSHYTDYYGKYGWYDRYKGPGTEKVVSFNLFAKSHENEQALWKYENNKAVIINTTISTFEDMICFVESRNPRLKLTKEGRAGDELFKNQFLVALDLKSGKKLWENAIETETGNAAYFMAAGSDKLVIVSSTNNRYYVYTFDAHNGEKLWENECRWIEDNHGGHFARPAIVGSRLVVKPAIFNINTGEREEYNMPKTGHGCGSYTLTEQSAFYRGDGVSQFNFDTKKFSIWDRLRPDCWISTVPALGMLLSPEGGGGCSCGNWLETSMVMSPIYRSPVTFLFGETKSTDSLGVKIKVKPGIKDETQFIDSLEVKIKVKPGIEGEIRYTIDGSEPGEDSDIYEKPILLDNSAVIKTALYIDKGGKKRRFVRDKEFERLWPKPEIVEGKAIINNKRSVELAKAGISGDIYYTTDNSGPSARSEKYDGPFEISEKTVLKAITIWKDVEGKRYKSDISIKEVDIPDMKNPVEVDVKNGINWEYYEGEWRHIPEFDKLEIVDKGIAPIISLADAGRREHFGMRFTGFVKVPADGVYTFFNLSDNGSRVYIHDELVVDNDGPHGKKEESGNIALKTGLHPIKVEYYQMEGGKALDVKIEGPQMERWPLTEDNLFH